MILMISRKVLNVIKGSLKTNSRSYSVRVRFAPSPTGNLHLGGLRTALYNYLFAKSKDGKFILRIEDTDQSRLVAGASEKLEEDLSWAGLVPDEGPSTGGDYGPYLQSQRLPLYQEAAEKLLNGNKAYHCFCSERRLKMIRDHAIRHHQVPKYDNHCRHLSPQELRNKLMDGGDSCIRLKLTHCTPFEDLIYGPIHHEVQNIEGDPILMKSDRYPTYHLANVVDDVNMAISHVIRGVEWLQSTNKHLLIYEALGFPPPSFAHLPLLLNSDGSKLSKRQGDVSVSSIRLNGVFPRALINFIIQAGSGFTKSLSPNPSLQELVSKFDLTKVSNTSCRLSMDRLGEFNKTELNRLLNEEETLPLLIEEVRTLVKAEYCPRFSESALDLDSEHIEKVLRWSSPRVSFLKELVNKNFMFLWMKPINLQLTPETAALLKEIMPALTEEEFTKQHLSSFLKYYSNTKDLPFKPLMTMLRQSLSGLSEGPGVAEIMEILGKKTSLDRLQSVINSYKDINKQ